MRKVVSRDQAAQTWNESGHAPGRGPQALEASRLRLPGGCPQLVERQAKTGVKPDAEVIMTASMPGAAR